MKRKTCKNNRSVNSASHAEFHHQGSRYGLSASNQSAETAYKLREREVAKEKRCVANCSNITALTAKQRSQEKWDYELDLINRFMRLEKILGQTADFVDLYVAGFSQEEIYILENMSDLLHAERSETEWEPFSTSRHEGIV